MQGFGFGGLFGGGGGEGSDEVDFFTAALQQLTDTNKKVGVVCYINMIEATMWLLEWPCQTVKF